MKRVKFMSVLIKLGIFVLNIFNEETYNMGSNYEISFDGLIEDTKYTAEITYDVVEPDTGRRYHGSESKSVTTLVSLLTVSTNIACPALPFTS